jgi:hypothetical protein
MCKKDYLLKKECECSRQGAMLALQAYNRSAFLRRDCDSECDDHHADEPTTSTYQSSLIRIVDDVSD